MKNKGVADVSLADDEVDNLLSRVKYRVATPTDIFQCFELEKSSYPPEIAASKNDLQYRQHHAANFFRCAVLEHDPEEENDEDVVVGYVCSTRCEPLEDDINSISSNTHSPNVASLTILSIVVKEEYRRRGLGTHMMRDYVEAVAKLNATVLESPVSKLLLYTKVDLLEFCLKCGFSVIRPARNPTGTEKLYLSELQLISSNPFHRRDPSLLLQTPGRECYIVDSFAAAHGTGNPAAVVLLPQDTQVDSSSTSKWMQKVAAEFNLSETAFIWPRSQTELLSKELHWNIRYFTPKVEVPLCGHATLASAAVLFQTLPHQADYRIVFHASEDDLTMVLAESSIDGDPLRTKISMEFPSKPPKELTTADDKSAVRIMLESAFNCTLEPLYLGISDLGDILIELTPDTYNDIGYEKLNIKALMEWDGYYRGVIICCTPDGSEQNGDEWGSPDFLSRFFGPKAGINEDPVTGSAHCVLGPYYAEKLNKNRVVGKQTSERGGIVECEISGDKVRLTGAAFTTVNGTLWM